jgi:shikimate dehydrogenase
MKRQFGLIGYPLGHSYSADYFAKKFADEGIMDAAYKAYPLSNIRAIRSFVRSNDLLGFSVTIPYKTDILSYLDELSESASIVGAVNTVKVMNRSGRLIMKGYNTDMPAFLETLIPLVEVRDVKAIVLGNGGASKAVCSALTKMNIPYIIVSRQRDNDVRTTFDDLTAAMIHSHHLIINTTPLGMFPEINSFPEIPYKGITHHHVLYDLVYNPEKTVFLSKGTQAGATTVNGLAMLHLQADYAWKIWNE